MLTTYLRPFVAVIADGALDDLVKDVSDYQDVIGAIFEAETVSTRPQ